MKCPECGSERTSVEDSRKAEGSVVRERRCADCGVYFWTTEVVIPTATGKLLRSLAMSRKVVNRNEDHGRKTEK